jgi:hypothetical protein
MPGEATLQMPVVITLWLQNEITLLILKISSQQTG